MIGVTVFNRLGRLFLVTVAGFAALQPVACGRPASPTWVAASPSSTRPAADSPTATRLARITSACKLLPATTVVKILGGSSGTKLAAKEEPVEKRSNGNRWFHCSYGRNGQEPFALAVATMPNRANTTKETIDALAKEGGTSSRSVAGLGAGAVSFVDGGFRQLASVVPYGTELRLVMFVAPTIVPEKKLAEVTRHVLRQI
jgi:hypothetical protein